MAAQHEIIILFGEHVLLLSRNLRWSITRREILDLFWQSSKYCSIMTLVFSKKYTLVPYSTSWSIWSLAKYFNSWLLMVFSLSFGARSNIDCKNTKSNNYNGVFETSWGGQNVMSSPIQDNFIHVAVGKLRSSCPCQDYFQPDDHTWQILSCNV